MNEKVNGKPERWMREMAGRTEEELGMTRRDGPGGSR